MLDRRRKGRTQLENKIILRDRGARGSQGRIQNFGKGRGSNIYIHNWGEGTGGGVPPPVTARGFWGSADSSPAPAAFLDY